MSILADFHLYLIFYIAHILSAMSPLNQSLEIGVGWESSPCRGWCITVQTADKEGPTLSTHSV